MAFAADMLCHDEPQAVRAAVLYAVTRHHYLQAVERRLRWRLNRWRWRKRRSRSPLAPPSSGEKLLHCSPHWVTAGPLHWAWHSIWGRMTRVHTRGVFAVGLPSGASRRSQWGWRIGWRVWPGWRVRSSAVRWRSARRRRSWSRPSHSAHLSQRSAQPIHSAPHASGYHGSSLTQTADSDSDCFNRLKQLLHGCTLAALLTRRRVVPPDQVETVAELRVLWQANKLEVDPLQH